MDSVLPIELVEAARIDGAHEFRIFNQIVLPLMEAGNCSTGDIHFRCFME